VFFNFLTLECLLDADGRPDPSARAAPSTPSFSSPPFHAAPYSCYSSLRKTHGDRAPPSTPQESFFYPFFDMNEQGREKWDEAWRLIYPGANITCRTEPEPEAGHILQCFVCGTRHSSSQQYLGPSGWHGPEGRWQRLWDACKEARMCER
jgi:hypothetical protein